MPETWLTVTEIARRLGRPPSTVRYWRNSYRPESRADEDGRATYRLGVFERIDVLVRRRTPPSEIRRILAEDGGTEPPEGYEAAVLRELRAIRTAVERLADRAETTGEEG